MSTYAMSSDSTALERLKNIFGLLLSIVCIGLTLFVSQLWSVGGFGAWGVSYAIASVAFLVLWILGRTTSDEPGENSSFAVLVGKYSSGILAVIGMYGSLSCMLGVWLSVMPREVSIIIMASLVVGLTALLAIWISNFVRAFIGRPSDGVVLAGAVIGFNAFYPEQLMTLMDLHPRGGVSFSGGLLVVIIASGVVYFAAHQISSRRPDGHASFFSTMRTPLNLFGISVRRSQLEVEE